MQTIVELASDTIYTGNNKPAAAIGDMISAKLGTAKAATTGKPPLPSPTNTAAKVARLQNIRPGSMLKIVRARIRVSAEG